MKKFFIVALTLLAVGSVSAQKSAVKEAEGKAKSLTPDYGAARSLITPALTNEETKNDAQTWYVAGLIEFGNYDNLNGKRYIGESINENDMATSLMSGFNYLKTALPLDSVPQFNKDGSPKINKKTGEQEIKTKYSKDIVKLVAGHYGDFLGVGGTLYNSQKYKDAYDAWYIYTTLPSDPVYGKHIAAEAIPNDTTIAEFTYNMALAAWQNQEMEKSLAAFEKAMSMGYGDREPLIYDYAISIASNLNDEAKVLALANEANAKYGATTEKYISIIINDKINKEQYTEAMELLNKAIEVAPSNAELYNLLGILYQSQKDFDKARATLEKAYALNSESATINFNLGRAIYAQGAAIDEANTNLPTAEYNKMRVEVIDPILKEAIPYLEYALKNDSTFEESKRLLRSLYYTINDDANLERIEKM